MSRARDGRGAMGGAARTPGSALGGARHPGILATALAMLLLPSCARIAFREAMGEVQEDAVRLQQALESRDNFRVRDACAALAARLEGPRVSADAPLAQDPEYQRLLGEAVSAILRIRERAQEFDPETLYEMRGEVAAGCDACHARFRRA